MLRHSRLEHRFVQYIPEVLEPGVIYISMEFATAAHSCCCGCGEQVITPFTPSDWTMSFDGETISLSPSIGNWKFRCHSHYIIRRSRVVDASPRKEQITKGGPQEKHQIEEQQGNASSGQPDRGGGFMAPGADDGLNLWERIKRGVRRKRW